MKFLSASSFWTPNYLVESAWHEHAPFAFWLTEIHRPRTFVELGTHHGFSYYCFCQGIERLGLEAKAFAVDTWTGDDHAGFYGEDVFQRLSEYHQRYNAFSRLVRSSFDQALPHFADGSIDLLHIDGRHFYDDVKHDFASWANKLSERAIVLFHDTNVRERGFEVFRFWHEISSHYRAFEFLHGHGLGVLAFGKEQSPELNAFFEAMADPSRALEVRTIYSNLGAAIASAWQLAEAKRGMAALERSVAEREQREAALNASRAEQKAHVTQGASKIAALGRSVADITQHNTTLAAQLGEAPARIAALEQSLVGAQHRATELSGMLDKRTVELKRLTSDLSEARGRIAALENTAAQHDQQIDRYQRRLVEMKPSLPWRLMSPFRKMYRPISRLRATPFGVKLAAALRHPSNSRKRKRYRAKYTLIETPVSFARAKSNPFTRDWQHLQVWALRLLAELVAPFSERRAARLRRSADKRDPKKIAEAIRRGEIDPNQGSSVKGPKATVTDPRRARRILVADYRLPQPDVSAGERATFGLISDLRSAGFDVVFCPTDMRDTAPYRQDLEALGVTVITAANGYPTASDYIQYEGATFGAFYLIRVDVAEAVLPATQKAAPDAIVVFHAPDLYFLRETRAAELSGNPTKLVAANETRAREVSIMRAADHVVLVSPAEIPFLEEFVQRDKISVFPALYSQVSEDPPGYDRRRHLFFLGGFKHLPNIDSVMWFVDKVWPKVRAALPDAEFHIVGAEAPSKIIALAEEPGVRHIGYVADLDPVLAGYRLSVAPLLYGAGIKGKVGASLGAGVPTVCTTIAAEGMGITDGVHALIRDEPEAFAAAVVALYQDEALWSRIAGNGRTLVRENFGEAANRSSFLRVLDRARVLPLRLYIESCQKAAPAAFPAHDSSSTIDVSIIVPVYNKWHLTRACLHSILIAGRATGIRYEVILADDGSKDETSQAGEIFPGLRVVRTERNLGFLLNCNNAAAQARGRHLLFLNNDTVVLPGWLEPLVRAMDDDPRIGIAGSKLLYPDGTIQESGAVLYSDSSATNLGRGRDRHARFYSLAREVDYATGASMLVRRELWQEVGGFDERYVPAYCEDSDIAMAARDKGYRVMCVADSQVVHFEHESYSEESATQPKALAKRNGAKLLEKWRSTFATDQLPPGTAPEIAAAHAERQAPLSALPRRRWGKLNVLYFSPFPSHPDNHGNQATIQAFGRRFRDLGHRVHFALLKSHLYDDAAAALMRAAWDSFDILPNTCGLGSNGQPIPFDDWYEDGLGERVRLLCSTHDIDVVFCSYVFQSKLLDYVPAHILKVIDTHDKMGDRYEMLRRNGQPLEFFSCTPDEEGAYLRRADIVVARRAEEAEYFDSVSGRKSAIVIPHVEEARFLDRTFSKLTDVGMVASANRINLAIALQFLQALERRTEGGQCPFTVHIAGQLRDMVRGLPSKDAALFIRPWIRLLGFVPDIGAFYGSVDAVVSPVTMGTGINVKTVQAMAYGMPLLTTAWGAKGIETGDPMHGHADLDALVASLFRLAEDPTPLAALAQTSRRRYQTFYDDSIRAMERMFSAVKL